MLRAYSTLGCPEADLRSVIALAERYRIDAIELRALGETINLPGYFASEFGAPEGFGAAAAEMKVRIACLDTSLHLADGKSSEREHFLTFLPWAEAAGIRWLRVFDGGAKLTDRAAISAAAAGVKWWREVRADAGYSVDIMVETHNRLVTSASINRFVKAAPGTAILWDSHHTWRQGGEDPVATWREIRRHVVHIHVNDSVGAPTPSHPFKYVLPGTGEFPMAPMREALAADQYEGALSLQWEKLWHPDLPSLEEALRVANENKWW